MTFEDVHAFATGLPGVTVGALVGQSYVDGEG
jgi:hypothetical protein